MTILGLSKQIVNFLAKLKFLMENFTIIHNSFRQVFTKTFLPLSHILDLDFKQLQILFFSRHQFCHFLLVYFHASDLS